METKQEYINDMDLYIAELKKLSKRKAV